MWEEEGLLDMSNFSFSHIVFKSFLLLMLQNKYLWSKGLNKTPRIMVWCHNSVMFTLALAFVL